MRLGLGAEVGDVDVTFLVASDRHDFEAGHYGAGGIGAMR